MEHLLLKAAVSAATDQGVFEAVVSTATIDRERDIVDPDGMVSALQKWTQTGKNIPLAWNHSGEADKQIGYIDPASAKNVNGEVVVRGWIDQSIPVGKDAWRLVKMGTLGFSFGYLVPQGGSVKRASGGEHIHQLDVFEVTASPTPMNNDTRVLGYKAATDDPAVRVLNSMIGQAQEFIANEDDQEDVDAMNDILEALQDLVEDENMEPPEPGDMPGKAVKDPDKTDDKASPPETAVQGTPNEASKAAPDHATRSHADPLRKQAEAIELEFVSGGESLRKATPAPEPKRPEPRLSLKELRARGREEMLTALLSGIEES